VSSLRTFALRMSPWEIKHVVRGETRHKQGDRVGAHADYVKVLKRNPKCWPAAFNLAVLMHQICEHEPAIALLRRLLRHEPRALEAWFNLGTILQATGDCIEAEVCHRRAVEIDPTFTSARVNLGNALLGLGRREEADEQYRIAMQQQPTNAEAVWNRSHYLILSGDWIEGWKAYEARWQIPGFCELNQIQVPDDMDPAPRPWTGQPLSGCTLLVSGEQGWGDDIMCLRYAPILRERGATVIWALREGLHRLAERTVYPDRVVDIANEIPPADYITTTMSLHHLLKVTPATVPGADGYLLRAA